MLRVAPALPSSRVVIALVCMVVMAGCVPSMPRFSSSNHEADEPAPPQVSSSTGQVIDDAAAAPAIDVDPLAAPGGPSIEGQGAARPSGNDVIVPAGKTLYGIAREHEVAVRDLIELNQIDPPYHLLVGQRLQLPTERTYLVQRGDTLYSVARRLGVDLHLLVQRNDLVPPYKVVTGTRLKLPSPSEPLGTATAPSTPRLNLQARAVVPPPPPRPIASQAAAPEVRISVSGSAASPRPVGQRSARMAAPPARAGARFFWPVKGKVISHFGQQGGGVQHDGIAIAVPRGTPVKASENGVVAYAGSDLKAYGNLLLIRHADGWMTAYAHNEALLVHEGDVVRRGQVIARAGASGNAGASQAYFEIRHQGKPVDPLTQLAKG